MLKGKCESKLQPNCIYGSPSLSLCLPLPFPAICRPTHTRSEILSNIFLHNSPHGTNEATFSLKKMRFARFWMQAACEQPFPHPYFSLFYSFYLFSPSPCLLYLSWAYPLTAKTALTSEKVEAGQLIRNSSQSACSADGAYEQRWLALKLKVLRCNYPSSSRYISYIHVYMYVCSTVVCHPPLCWPNNEAILSAIVSWFAACRHKLRQSGHVESLEQRQQRQRGGRKGGSSFSSFLAAAH